MYNSLDKGFQISHLSMPICGITRKFICVLFSMGPWRITFDHWVEVLRYTSIKMNRFLPK